ncbi:MAG: glycosyltransferase, partial [Acidiferrobacterales bacterium]|nr:glycosyltransferase [Acidiferrobacterales bacterium]
ALSVLRYRTWRFLVGHNVPQDRFARLRAQAGGNLIVERSRKDFASLLRNCALSVSQAGYNTMLEVLEAGAPAVVIPYSDEREKEQAIRARMLRDCGLVELIDNEKLTPRCLAQAVDRVWHRPRTARPTIRMNGASTSASLIAGNA